MFGSLGVIMETDDYNPVKDITFPFSNNLDIKVLSRKFVQWDCDVESQSYMIILKSENIVIILLWNYSRDFVSPFYKYRKINCTPHLIYCII